jgi:two-component sensor histidine kinase
MAERLGLGEIVSPIKTPIEEVNKVGIALTEASYERSEAERRLWYTMREAVHRTKNMMSVVQAMMRQTARQSATVEEFRSKMQGRLTGLAHTVDLLTAEEWMGTSMFQLAKSHLDTFSMESGRISVIGDDFMVRPEVVQALGMALHELGTNAVKYGALSNRQGTIVFSWETNRVDGSETIFSWIEKDGPLIEPPETTGFGTALLDGFVAAAVNGRVQLQYFPAGLVWQLTAPKSSVEAVREKPLLRPKSSPVAATF